MLRRVLHTGVQVADLAAAVEFYRQLGFEVDKEFSKPELKAKAVIVRRGETAFELFEFEDNGHPQVEFIRSHIAFYSDNLENDIQKMLNGGFELVIPVTEGVIYRYAYVRDRAGAVCYEIATEKTL